MNPPSIPFKIEPMTLADIPASVAVDQAAYAANFALRSYQDELEYNRLAHYFVIRPAIQAAVEEPSSALPTVVGQGGFWLIAEELHVITIAVQPRYQRLGLGEWLLLTMIEEGQKLGAEVATLEVRPSNHKAIALYQKYGFQEVGRRRAYYPNTGEDALILTISSLHSPDYQGLLADHKTLLLERLARIKIDKIP